MAEWYDHLCACGCGGRIQVQPHHKYYRIPQYIHGHNHKNRRQDPEHIRKRSQALTGRIRSSEECEKQRQIALGLWRDPDYVEKQVHSRSVSTLFQNRGPKLSAAAKRNFRDPDYLRRRIETLGASPNKTEILLQSILDEHFPNQWEFVGDGQLIIAGKCPDFVHRECKLLIELFGDYWHSEEVTGVPKKQHEQERIQLFESEGYQTLVIWEHEMSNTDQLVRAVQDFCSGVVYGY